MALWNRLEFLVDVEIDWFFGLGEVHVTIRGWVIDL